VNEKGQCQFLVWILVAIVYLKLVH